MHAWPIPVDRQPHPRATEAQADALSGSQELVQWQMLGVGVLSPGIGGRRPCHHLPQAVPDKTGDHREGPPQPHLVAGGVGRQRRRLPGPDQQRLDLGPAHHAPARLAVQAQHGLPARGEQREVGVGAREERGSGDIGGEGEAGGGDEGVEEAAAVGEGEAGEVGGGGGGVGLEEEGVGEGVEGGGEEAGEEGVVGGAVEEEEGGVAAVVGEELEDGGPEEARGELLGDGADGDEGEEAREGEDEVAELGVLVGPEAEERGGDAVAAGQGVGVERRGGGGCVRHRRWERLRGAGRHHAAVRRPLHQLLHQGL